MIVDDEKSFADLMALVLKEHLSCPVTTFYRPEDALAALPEMDVGVIVTDYYMPEINGLDFLRRASSIKPTIPFIMITGHSASLQQTDFSDITQLTNVLAKPFGARALADEILKHWPEAAK